MFVLQPHSGVPLYRQLYEQIRRMVAGGQLAAGAELPSIRELAVKHAINPMTVAPQRRTQAARSTRLETLAPPLENLVLAARQLELGVDDVIDALRTKWEASDAAATVRGRARTRKVV